MSYYIGVMSGTSLDGIDVAITRFSKSGSFHFVTAQTFPFPPQLRVQLSQLITEQQCPLQELGSIDIALGQLIGQSVNQLLDKQQLSPKEIIAIGSHGQTIFHEPNGYFPFSHQIGNANVITETTGITTIADFRQRDIAAGGQGAPLVPAFHQSLFSSLDENRVIVNIGGISNLTRLPASTNDTVIGFDTGPGNVLIDYWTQLHLNKPYDHSGEWAKSGQCNEHLLALLCDEPYFKQNIPKSTGRELFNQSWFEALVEHEIQDLKPVDIQATLVELTAKTISADIKLHANSSQHVFVCGGGAHNDYLLNRLQSLLNDKKISTTEALGLHPDWVEACAFAWLAYRTMNGLSGNLPAVTGAKYSVVLGAIYPS